MIEIEAIAAFLVVCLSAIVILLAIIARDCSAIAAMMHDDREKRRHG
jgi:hypothetical protein